MKGPRPARADSLCTEGPFQRAGRTEVIRLTTEWTEVFVLAVRIGALDSSDALRVVTAENLKMLLGQKLEDVGSARLVHPLGDRGELEG